MDKAWVSDEIIVFTHVISQEGGGHDASTDTALENGVYVSTTHLALGFFAYIVVKCVPIEGVPETIPSIATFSYDNSGNIVIVY